MRRVIEQASETVPSAGDLKVTISGDMCFCNEDGCNGVGSLQPFLTLILVVAFQASFGIHDSTRDSQSAGEISTENKTAVEQRGETISFQKPNA